MNRFVYGWRGKMIKGFHSSSLRIGCMRKTLCSTFPSVKLDHDNFLFSQSISYQTSEVNRLTPASNRPHGCLCLSSNIRHSFCLVSWRAVSLLSNSCGNDKCSSFQGICQNVKPKVSVVFRIIICVERPKLCQTTSIPCKCTQQQLSQRTRSLCTNTTVRTAV